MKKYLLNIGLFFLIIIVLDLLSGKVFAYLVDNAKGGDNWHNNYICDELHEDILVFGSSRALRHYNSVILSDSLGLSCFNCGQDGNGIILNYAFYQLVCQRYHPKVLIYDITPGFDLVSGEDNHKYLGWIRAYYEREGIAEIFESVDNMEKYKMLSQMYKYNSKMIKILADYFHPIQAKGIQGFRPCYNEIDTRMSSKRDTTKKAKFPIYDSLKISYFKKMIEESDDTQIIFVVSPWWDGADTIPYQPAKDICKERDIPFIDFSNNPKYVHHNEYFNDGVHLNARGADEFTRDLVHVLKECGLIQQSAEKK